MYYICIEIWEEPRLLLFFVIFPLKSGIYKRIREKLGEGKEKFEEGKEKLCAKLAKLGDGKCSDKLKMLMSNRGKMAQNCWILGWKPTPTPP